VQGNSGSGKSHLLRRLLEQSAGWVQQVIIDPEGDFVTLADRYGHVVVEGERTEAELLGIAARVRQHRVSCVLSLEGLDVEDQMRMAGIFLNGLFDAERDFWYPVLVVVDEAQMFAPAASGEVSDEVRKLSLGSMTNLMCRGRKRGLAGVIATQRLAKLAKNVAAEASNFLMGRTFLDIDMARAADLLGMERRQAEAFRDLERGQFMALGPALSRRPLRLNIGSTETSPRNSTPRLMPLPEATLEDARAVILAAPPPDASRPQRRPAPDLLEQLRAAKAAAPEISPEAVEVAVSAEELAERRERVDRTLRAVLAAPDAGFRAIGVLYQEFVVRCRIEGLGAAVPDLSEFRRMLTHARAGVGTDIAEDDAWQEVTLRASILPDDMQGVFMMIARAAKEGWPCPGDAAIARAYGSHSLRRAQRLLGYMEEQGLIVVQLDGGGRRFITLVELAWATAPGDPNGDDQPAEQIASAASA